MTLTDLFEELYIAIKQDGHDIYFKAEDAEMLKSFIIEYMSFQKLIEYIKDIKKYYSDGSLCSLLESIVGERVCDDILKRFTELNRRQNEI